MGHGRKEGRKLMGWGRVYFDGGVFHRQRTGDLGRPAAVDDSVVFD